ncbi:bifunctional adenosylcobinamide kinase/adenosylcobinamide-phosphate guanylyltransferase [Nocardioides perillae]|uniref:Adenosylcobinamide kinase n=1 Tax=Nocardioides perillae TaxID=1119534 RepID=A0A7Y9USE4_9ACTN|nr:adenosylcobinamide kinase/adenosylcobinamide-phosphate guanylyltransferase [Nocardioides perillae]
MRLRLLGTGAADGWPNAFCRCASCGAERAAGRWRTQTSALLDDVLLLDCGPATPAAAERCGTSLAGVRAVLWTHQHADHCSPATLMFRDWVGDAPLVVLGPPDAVAAARPWLSPDAPVTWVPVRPGEVHEVAGCTVRVLEAAHRTGLGDGDAPDAVLYDVATPDGGRLLWATDTGALPAATVAAAEGAAYDVVALEETFGDRADLAGEGHLGLVGFAEQLRRLRAVGAVVPGTDVLAVHLSHHNPPTPELARRLRDCGARVVDDGTVVTVGPHGQGEPGPVVPPSTGRTLVLGGARSGKSREAERLLTSADDVTYVATSYPPGDDPEWVERVARHRAQRPARWTTLETTDLVPLLQADGGPLLVDCLTLWLTRVFDAHDAWDDDAWAAGAGDAVAAECAALVAAWCATGRRVVAVSNEVGQGLVPATAALRRWRDEVGRLNAALAAESEDVRWCVAGRVVRL